MNYDEWLAVESAKENSTFEMALLACKQHVKKTVVILNVKSKTTMK